MANGFALSQVCGYLTSDPELKNIPTGTALCTIRIAVNDTYRDKKTGELVDDTLFLECRIYGPRAEAYVRYHKKGSPTLVDGRLKMAQWTDKATGQNRSFVYLKADNWHFVPKTSGAKDAADSENGVRGIHEMEAGETPF